MRSPALRGPLPEAAGGGTPPSRAEATARTHIRGSSLLLVGRLISVGLNFAVQVLTVRYLAKSDYGAFAYGLGVVSIGSSVALAGMGKAIPRIVPIHLERERHARAFGSIAIALGTVAGLGISAVLLLHGFRGSVAGALGADPAYLPLLLVLIVLVPLDAFDGLLQFLVTVFSGPRAIFVRRQVLGPALRLAAILAVKLVEGNAYTLAYGYLIGGMLGASLYIVVLAREWRRQGLLEHLRPARLEWPVREVFGLSIPLLSSELTIALRGSLVVVLLGYFATAPAVAEYRAVLPVAGLNMVVFEAFAFLFVPLASRMFARNEHGAIHDLYWQTCLWIAVLTFPVFAVTTALATPVTVLLFGERYASAGPLVAILAVGHYLHAALGFNSATLTVHGRVRTIVVSETVAAAGAFVFGFVLIPRYGALGAAIATTCTLVLQNACNHVGLWSARTGVRPFEWRFARLYGVVAAAALAVWAAQWLLNPPLYVGAGLIAAAWAAVAWLLGRGARLETHFPELLRVPLVGRMLRAT